MRFLPENIDFYNVFEMCLLKCVIHRLTKKTELPSGSSVFLSVNMNCLLLRVMSHRLVTWRVRR